MSEWSDSLIERLLIQPGGLGAETLIADLLASQWRDPAVCHLAGLYHLWRAVDLESKQQGEDADPHWEMMIPHLVYALENDAYMRRFCQMRERTYEQTLDEVQIAAAKQRVYDHIGERLKGIASRSSTEQDHDRTQKLRDLWSMEIQATRLMADFGGVPDGVPDGGSPARRLIAGPAFAQAHGFYQNARDFIEATPADKSMLDEIVAFLSGKPRNDGQDIRYCFSDLARPYLYWRQGFNGKALDALGAYSKGNVSDDREGLVGEAAKTRYDALRLSVEIRVAAGSDSVRCGGPSTREGLALWGQALMDVDVLDAQTPNPMQRRGDAMRQQMQVVVRDQVARLEKAEHYDESISVLEEFIRIVPREESVRDLASLLHRLANRASQRDEDDRAADYRQQACLLLPHYQQLRMPLLVATANAAQMLLKKNNYKAAAERCMDLLSLTRDYLKEFPDDQNALQGKQVGMTILNHLLPKLDECGEQELLRFSIGFIAEELGQAPEGLSEQIEPVRLANRSHSRYEGGDFAGAFRDVESALRLQPDNSQLRQLYENLTCAMVNQLCKKDQIDEALRIAEQAKKAMPASVGIEKAYTRAIFRRLDINRLLSPDPEEVASQLALLERWVGEDEQDEQVSKQAERFAILVNKDLQNEAQLNRARALLQIDHDGPAPALALLESMTLTGTDLGIQLQLIVKARSFLGDLEGALRAANELQERFPNHAAAYQARAKIFSLMARFDEAETDLTLIRENLMDDGDAVRYLAYNGYRAGNYEDAIADLHLTHEVGEFTREDDLVECACLMHLKRSGEIPALMAKVLPEHRAIPWERKMLTWYMGELDDRQFLESATAEIELLEARFFLGEKLRAAGDRAAGNALIRKCAASGLATQFEWEHATAMLNSGTLD